MGLIINKLQHNLIKKEFAKIEEAYKQSNDIKIRNCVKELSFYKLCEAIPLFEEMFTGAFTECDMSSLYMVDSLFKRVLESIEVEVLPEVDMTTIKKLFRKLPEKDQRAIGTGYNNAIKKTNLAYYTHTINGKKAILIYVDGEFEGFVCETSPNIKGREIDCHFCHTFRRGKDIEYLSKVEKGKNGTYNSRTITCCSDYNLCNDKILTLEPLKEFLKIGEKNEKNRYRDELGK